MSTAHATVSAAFARGEEVSDGEFDALLTQPYRQVSGHYWTPVDVARTAATWLADSDVDTVLDVGAGVGKFCIVATLATRLRVTGIEQRFRLVVEAANLVSRFGLEDRCRVCHGTIECLDLASFDALYVFNSFAENVYSRGDRLDETVELSHRRMKDDLRILEDALTRMPLGGAFLTYHGFGGRIPDTFDLVRDRQVGSGELRHWIKKRRGTAGRRWIEIGDDVVLVEPRR